MEASVEVTCPYCAETSWTFVDLSQGPSTYIEDCQVCCRPMLLKVSNIDYENSTAEIFAMSEEEY